MGVHIFMVISAISKDLTLFRSRICHGGAEWTCNADLRGSTNLWGSRLLGVERVKKWGKKWRRLFHIFHWTFSNWQYWLNIWKIQWNFNIFFSQDSIDFPLKGSRWRGTNPSVSGFGHVVFFLTGQRLSLLQACVAQRLAGPHRISVFCYIWR